MIAVICIPWMLIPKPIYLLYCKRRAPTRVEVKEKSSGIEDKFKETLQKPLLKEMGDGGSNEDAVSIFFLI